MRLLALLAPAFLFACTSGEKPGDSATTGTGNDSDSGTQVEGTPNIVVDPLSVDLGYLVPDTAGTADITVQNTGDATLEFNATLSGGYTVDAPSGTVAAGGTTTLKLSFSAHDVGSYPGEMQLTSNDPDAGTVSVTLLAQVDVDTDGDGSPDSADCQPFDPEIYPGNTEIWYDGIDQDCDGKDDDRDGDGYDHFTDCNDTDPTAHPGGTEIWYNGVDEDCDGNDADQDRDGSLYPDDCDDHNAAVSPNAVENWYNGIDENCDGNDADQDKDGSNYPTDCNDINASVYPGAIETCNGVDDDCNGVTDDATVGATTWYADTDLDGYGNPGSTAQACNAPAGYVANSLDCDDIHNTISPAAKEVCDNIDNDCNGVVDDNPTDGTLYYVDNDGDGYGSTTGGVLACSATGGLLSDHSDCDDADAAVHPGVAEISYNGKDDNCDGVADQLAVGTASSWTVRGTTSSQAIGAQGVMVADDQNGDGDAELILTSTADDTNGTDAGALAFHDNALAGTNVNFSSAFLTFVGPDAGDYFGSSPVLLGDVTGDGYDDIVVGAAGDDTEGTDGGAVYVVSQYSGALLTGTQDASGVASGYISSTYGGFGSTIAVGDFDADGNLDLVGGAPNYSNRGNYYGRSLVYNGGDVSWWSGSYVRDDAFNYTYGASGGDYLGSAIVAGDFNDDGYDDLVTCAPYRSSSKGSCYFVDGTYLYYYLQYNAYPVNSIASAEFQGANSGDYLGYSQTGIAAGDLDNDGVPDLAIGAPGYDGSTANGGAVLVMKGGAWSGTYTPSSVSELLTGDGALGTGVSIPGDVNNDGSNDLVVGAPSNGAGTVYLVAGGSFTSGISLPTGANASWTGETSGDYFGAAIGGYTDLDGDGHSDLAAVSSKAASGATTNVGKVYVFRGY